MLDRSRPVGQNYSMVRESQEDRGRILVTNQLRNVPKIAPVFDQFKGGLVVSCQATEGTPMNTPEFIAAPSHDGRASWRESD